MTRRRVAGADPCPMRRAFAVAGVAAVLGLGLPGCTSTRPAVCDSVDQLRQSVNHLTNASLSENGMSALAADLNQVKSDLSQVATDAKPEFQPQTDQLKVAVDQLSASVNTAKADPNATTLGGVGAAVRSVKTAVESLVGSLSNTC
jgi:hypothetical protein